MKEWKPVTIHDHGRRSMPSEAYLEGMETPIVQLTLSCSLGSEAYLEGMETPLCNLSGLGTGTSEAYLEGMETLYALSRREQAG